MKSHLSNFLIYLRIEKNCSLLTIIDYRLELEKFILFLEKKNLNNLTNITTSIVRE